MHIGCDIIENKRLKDKDDRFISLILTKKEKEEYQKKGFFYLCGRFAAKEAIMKVLDNTKDLNFLDIEVLTNEDGSPKCNIENVEVSISHEKNYTIAVALLKKFN